MQKTLYLIRHAEGEHNVAAGKKTPKPAVNDPEYESELAAMKENHAMRNRIYESEDYRDAPLSPHGLEQVKALRAETDE